MVQEIRRIRPKETRKYLDNPHRGCCTFQHVNGEELFPGTSWSEQGPEEFPLLDEKTKYDMDKRRVNPNGGWPSVVKNYLPSTVAYYRWFWPCMEPEEGKYDFDVIEKTFELCRRRGQTMALRLMAFGSVHNRISLPDWYIKKYPVVDKSFKSVTHFYPDHDAPEYYEKWGGFIREFASRYDGHPLLETIDVTFIGPWGEGCGDISVEQTERFIKLWAECFKKTPRLSLIGNDQMRIGMEHGSGWRCDCFGDCSNNGSKEVPKSGCWNHMQESYPMWIYQCNATDAWKTAPVHFESCWVPMHWYQYDFDLDFIIQQGLKYHGTYFMPKYTEIPDQYMDKLFDFCQRLGYHYVLRQATIPRKVEHKSPILFKAWIENTGVAPIYHDYDIAVRFRQDDDEHIVVLEDVDLKKFLPGDLWIDEMIPMPEGLRHGFCEIALGIVHPETKEAKINFATEDRFSDRWVDLFGFEIK